MNFTLKIWRQKDAKAKGAFETYKVENISADTSFLEMLDILNNNLIHEGKEPVAFDHDCREGICGMCSLHIDGRAHGPGDGATTCQIYMRRFKDGATIVIEPWRSAAFPVIKDLVVDRSAYDKILQAGGFISVRTNAVQDANNIPIPKADADVAMDAAACIGCGACAATCKNGSAMLFVAARVSSLAKLPQGRVEGARRAKAMVPLLVPLFVSSFRRANELAMAMESRCHRGGDKRTRLRELKYTKLDLYGALAVAAFLVIIVAEGRLLG